MAKNLLLNVTEQNTAGFNWEHGSQYTCLPGGGIRISAPAQCDYFQDPAGRLRNDSAPYLHLDVTGDFVAKALVAHPFRFNYDAAALMVRQDARHWAKLCFEATDFGTHAVVSVVTDGVSDDANGVNYHWPQVWLQMVRKDNLFALHYAPDGEQWNMVRLFSLELSQTVQVGMVAQCPIGAGTEIDFLHFSLEQRSVEDIRTGR
jgi:regulation of enolase protein 1 (concanavalin A-like superfamily)